MITYLKSKLGVDGFNSLADALWFISLTLLGTMLMLAFVLSSVDNDITQILPSLRKNINVVNYAFAGILLFISVVGGMTLLNAITSGRNPTKILIFYLVLTVLVFLMYGVVIYY